MRLRRRPLCGCLDQAAFVFSRLGTAVPVSHDIGDAAFARADVPVGSNWRMPAGPQPAAYEDFPLVGIVHQKGAFFQESHTIVWGAESPKPRVP